MKTRTCFMALVAALGLLPQGALAGIADDAKFQHIIVTTFVVEQTRARCTEIDIDMQATERMIVDMANHTAAMGYTQDEVQGQLMGAEAQARLTAAADEYMKAKGADPTNPASVCAFAQAEIAAGTDVGMLLKSR